MKVILSPAKALNFEGAPQLKNTTIPVHIENSEYLINKLRKLSKRKIGKLMNISPALVELNFDRYQSWELPFTQENSKAALYVFNGEAYRGLDAASFKAADVKSANDRLRILSGLYGLLKPSDLIQPYRLEMGTSLKVTPKLTNLYKYWGDTITNQLNSELNDDDILVNVASKEYFKSIDFNKLKAKVITCHFKENRNGEYKAIMTFAKNARGKMARFIIKNKLNKAEELRAFNEDGYYFNNDLSNDKDFVFTREGSN